MSAGFVDELIRLVVKYEGSEVRRGKVDVDQLATSLKAADVAGKSLSNTSGKGGNLGMSMLMLSQFMDDAQYGIRGVLNNIPGLAMAFGAGPGLAGALSLATLAGSKLFDVLNSNNKGIENQAGLLNRDLRPAWQKTWDEISRTFVNALGGGFMDDIRAGDMGAQGGQGAVDAAKKRMQNQADAAINAVTGVGKFSEGGIGQAIRDQISKAGGGEQLMTTLVDALVPKNAPPEAAAAARDNIAKAIAEALDGHNVNGLVQYLRQANQGDLADKIIKAIIPAQRAQAERKAREALQPLMEGIGAALNGLNPNAPGMGQQQAASAAAGLQGRMAGAGIDSNAQKFIAEYLNGAKGRRWLRFVPVIVQALGDAGFSEREIYEGMVAVMQLLDRNVPLVTAIQRVINTATSNGMGADLRRMGMSQFQQDAEAGAAMLGMAADSDPNRQSRFRFGQGDFGGGNEAAGAADGGFRKRGMVKQDDRTPEERAAALDELNQQARFEGARAEAKRSTQAAGLSGTPDEQLYAFMLEMAQYNQQQAVIQAMKTQTLLELEQALKEYKYVLEKERGAVQRLGRQ